MNAIIVCGGREWRPTLRAAQAAERWLVLHCWRLDVAVVVHGDAEGADRWAAEVVRRRLPGVHVHAVPADWQRYGRAAGPIRNAAMVVVARGLGQLVGVLALPGGAGTADMTSKGRAAGVEVISYRSG